MKSTASLDANVRTEHTTTWRLRFIGAHGIEGPSRRRDGGSPRAGSAAVVSWRRSAPGFVVPLGWGRSNACAVRVSVSRWWLRPPCSMVQNAMAGENERG